MKFEMNIANKITILRIVAIPLYLLIVYFDRQWSDVVATVVFTIAGFSDMLDGYLARKYNLITDFGKVMDPVADKIFVTAAMIALVEMARLPGWIVVVMLARDFTIGALRDLSASKGILIPAGIWGKLKTTAQMIAVGMLTLKGVFYGINWSVLGMVTMYVALILSLYSGYVYVREYFKNNKVIGQ